MNFSEDTLTTQNNTKLTTTSYEPSYAPGKMDSHAPEDTKPGVGASQPPLALVWKNLTYDVKVPAKQKTAWQPFKKDQKRILNQIYGSLQPGEFMAVMGTSGAGKTTCLNVIASRHLEGGTIGGTIMVNGRRRDASFRKLSAYVEQEDILMPFLTVRETFYFSAELRMPKRYSLTEKKQHAERVITRLGISSAIDTRIGDTMNRGISGGERKRVAIGTELLLNPRVLFLDEPTSGLDSFTSFHVMQTVKNLAIQENMATMTTIHQPRADLFALFDTLLLLSAGRVAYYGPVNQVLSIFEKAGYPCHVSQNPADHLLDITTFDRRTPETESDSKARIDNIIDTYTASDIYKTAQDKVDELIRSSSSTSSAQKSFGGNLSTGDDLQQHSATPALPAKAATQWRLNHFEQGCILFRRNMLNYLRNPAASIAIVAQSVVMGIIAGVSFLKIGIKGAASIQDRAGALFFITLMCGMSPVFATLNIFHSEKALFIRERNASTYRASAYFVAKALGEFPVQALSPILLLSISYFIIGFYANAANFFKMLLTLIFLLFTAQSWGMLLSAVAPNLQIAQAFAPVIIIGFTLFSGFYYNKSSMSPGVIWIYYISFISYGLAAMFNIEFSQLKFDCSGGEPNCFATGNDVLKFYSMNNSFWYYVGILLLIGILARFAAFFAFYFITKPKTAKEKKTVD